MLKKMMISTVIILMVFALIGCAAEKPLAVDNQVSSEATQEGTTDQGTAEIATDETTDPVTEESAQSGETAWPVSKMGNLPVPECQVVSVMEYDASSMSGELIIVNYSGMSKEFAASYIVMLAELGFVDGVSLNSNGKIIFSGTAQDASAVNFDYDEATQGGNISYKPVPK